MCLGVLLLQEAEEGTALGKSSKSLEGALGGDLAGAMTRSLLQALRSGGSAGQHSTAPCHGTTVCAASEHTATHPLFKGE